MDYLKAIQDHVGSKEEKFYKAALFRSDAMLLGVNCLEPGQVQEVHEHAGQDKFYFVVEGKGLFRVGEEKTPAKRGDVIWAPAGILHGVSNESDERLTLLVGIAPAP